MLGRVGVLGLLLTVTVRDEGLAYQALELFV